MRKFISSLPFLLLSFFCFSQSPQGFNYQAVIRNTDGTVKANETVAIQIKILHGYTDGPPVYMEIHNTQTNQLGLVNLVIGDGATSDDLSAIDWANGPYFLEITVNGTLLGTSQLISVPYALYAARVDEEYILQMLDSLKSKEYEESDPIQDIDGNEYKTVLIGDQIWMAENIKVTHYPDGSTIPNVTEDSDWWSLDYTDDAWCYYNNDSRVGDTYGALYNWAAATNNSIANTNSPNEVQGVCPDGWHLPSDEEWNTLTEYLGGKGVAGGKMKEIGGSEFWKYPNVGATNESSFTALGGGSRPSGSSFTRLRDEANFWTSTEVDSAEAWVRILYYDSPGIRRTNKPKNSGFSVRCIKNNP